MLRLAEGGIEAETRQVCENLKAVLEAAGSSLGKVAKVTIYMADLGELMADCGSASRDRGYSDHIIQSPRARPT